MDIYGEQYAAQYNAHWPAWSGGDVTPFIIDRVRRRHHAARTWLDLCCGTGQTMAEATDAGFEVVGVDASRHQLTHARRNAPRAEVHRADVCTIQLKRRFDVITCLGGSVNYLTTRADLQRLLRNMQRHVAPGGCIVLDSNTTAGLEASGGHTHAERSADQALIVTISYEPDRQRAHWRITGFRKEGRLYRRFDEHHTQRAWNADDLVPRMQKLGWTVTSHDADALTRARKDSLRLLLIAHAKP